MAASSSDYLMEVGKPGSATTMSAPGHTSGGTSITVASTTNWPTGTGVTFAIDTVTVAGNSTTQVAGTYTVWRGVVTSATTIGSMVLSADSPNSDQNYSAGSLTRVYITISAAHTNRTIQAMTKDHDQLTGYHKTLNDASGNEWIKQISTASAVNEITVANAATGTGPTISATGGDTNIDLKLTPKGSGKVYIDGSAPRSFFALYDFIESGCVWSGDAYASTRNASMTAGVVWIGGKRLTVAAVTARSFTASKDVYVDLLDNGDGTAIPVYTDNVTNAASPALAANSVRNAIIVVGATNIAAATSVNQGQETMVVPIASSIPYAVTDSLGNLICPRDPQRKILGYRQITSNFATASTTAVAITGLSAPIIAPSSGRKIRATVYGQLTASTLRNVTLSLWDGAVGGTQLVAGSWTSAGASYFSPQSVSAVLTVAAGSKTINASLFVDAAGTGTVTASAISPAYLVIELI